MAQLFDEHVGLVRLGGQVNEALLNYLQDAEPVDLRLGDVRQCADVATQW